MLHGCSIADNSLIGIGAVVLNNAKIGSNCVIGANSFIPPEKKSLTIRSSLVSQERL